MKLKGYVAAVIACLATGQVVLMANPPGLVNYQGVLRDAADAPVTASLDMIFHFYDAAAAGNEILVDRHLAGLMGDVAVSGGLFNVALGGGALVDGSAAGTYATLAEVFRDFGEVYLEVEIETPMGFEPLAPRTQIVSAAYALSAGHAASAANASNAANAEFLDGTDASQFLRSDASDTFTAGTLTLNAGTKLDVQGNLFANGSVFMEAHPTFAGRSHGIHFSTDLSGAEIYYDEASEGFKLWGASLAVSGAIRVGGASGGAIYYNRFGSSGTLDSGAVSNSSDIYVEDDLELDGTLYLNSQLLMDDDGPDHDQFIYFYEAGNPTGVSIAWDDSADLLLANETLRALSLETAADAISINPDGPDSTQSLFFFEDGSRTGEAFRWNNTADYFDVSESLFVNGNIDASGTKLFIQNHPYRADLSVAYVALEGDEAGTFTRGVGRLVGGQARVALGETFALVTNPDIGLTTHLTPRGAWAELYAESLTTSEIVVRAAPGSPQDIAFDYIVFGLRIGHEDHRALRPRAFDAPVPFERHYEELYAAYPELRPSSALQRYRGMSDAAGIVVPEELPASAALRQAIGEHDPEAPAPVEHLELVQARAAAIQPRDGVVDEPGATPPSSVAPARGSVAVEIHSAESAEPEVHGRSVRSSREVLSITMPVEGPMEAGDVLVVDAELPRLLRLASRAADPAVAGVASDVTKFAGDAVSSPVGAETGQATVVVGGVVACKVDASYGEIRGGDLLTTSPTPGRAMRAAETAPGTIVGKALEPWAVGTGTIQVLVMLR